MQNVPNATPNTFPIEEVKNVEMDLLFTILHWTRNFTQSFEFYWFKLERGRFWNVTWRSYILQPLFTVMKF